MQYRTIVTFCSTVEAQYSRKSHQTLSLYPNSFEMSFNSRDRSVEDLGFLGSYSLGYAISYEFL